MSQATRLTDKVLRGSAWQFTAKFSQALISLLVQIILARLLLPQDFALIALCAIVIELAELIVDGGFASALIQNDSLDQEDLHTVFICNLVIALLLFAGICVFAPSIALFFHRPDLSLVLIIISTGIPISSLGNVQNALLQRAFKFKQRTFASVSAIAVSGVMSVVCASLNAGVWALVVGQLLNRVIYTSSLIYLARYRPSFAFSRARFCKLASFGCAVLLSNVVFVIQRQLATFFIGRNFSPQALGFVSVAQRIDKTTTSSLEGSLMQALFPAFSSLQQDLKRYSSAITKALNYGNFIFIPLIVSLIAVAPELIEVLFGSRWTSCVPYLQAISFSSLILLTYNTYKQACLGLAYSKEALYADLIVLVASALLICLVLPFGIIWIFIIQLPIRLGAILYMHYKLKKILDFNLADLLMQFMKIVLVSLVLFFVIQAIGVLSLNLFLKLLLQILFGIISYLLMARLFCPNMLFAIVNVIRFRAGNSDI